MASEQAGAMPPGGPQLTAGEREAFRQWITEGAVWPEGVTLKGAEPAAAAPADERGLEESLHRTVTANSTESEPARMKPYDAEIPGTDFTVGMTPVPGGEFTMGSPESEAGRNKDEGPQRRVKIEPFWMAKTEITWDVYRLFMFSEQADEAVKNELVDAVSRPTRPYVELCFGMGINGYPAISMTQHAANKFAQWLSAKTGQFYRLPTEAEWEYACRAGTATAYSFGDDASQLGEYAWYYENSDTTYQQVGKKKPNPWGLHDMHGNVVEWTLDQYAPYPAADGLVESPWVKATEPYPHVARGGSWFDDPEKLRCAARVESTPDWKMQDPQLPKSIWYLTDAQWLGFRVIRPLKVPSADEMYDYWNSGVENE
jgi:formylglycine-generating enzyme required for sulfatase activity